MLYSNNIFEVMSVDPIRDDEDSIVVYKHTDPDQMAEERHRMSDTEKERFLTLKGQMFYMEEWESICFMGIPVMSHLPQMHDSGLFINDFALHDSSRDLVLASTQQAAELKLLLHQEAQKSRNMQENVRRLKRERRRADKLLYQLLPKSVANKLRNGESAVACCERFDSVTILCTDIVGFTQTCSSMNPMEVIELLTEIYTNFDKVVDDHGVYKVETIGDAYIVVSGAPTRTVHDVEYALDCATHIVKEVGKQIAPKYGKIEIRAGLHSGAIVAGVVGLKMPRYCLFGETMFIASMMEQHSLPMRVTVSEATVNKIEETDPSLYQFERRDDVEIKPGVMITTFFVIGRHGNARAPSPRACDSRAESMASDENEDELDSSLEKNDRISPTTEAAVELRKRSTGFTPVSDAEIESHSRSSSVVQSTSHGYTQS